MENVATEPKALNHGTGQVWVIDDHDLMVASWAIMAHLFGEDYDDRDWTGAEFGPCEETDCQELMAQVFSDEHCFGHIGTFGYAADRRENAERFIRESTLERHKEEGAIARVHDGIMALRYDTAQARGVLTIADADDCPRMRGVVDLFQRLDPKVKCIEFVAPDRAIVWTKGDDEAQTWTVHDEVRNIQ